MKSWRWCVGFSLWASGALSAPSTELVRAAPLGPEGVMGAAGGLDSDGLRSELEALQLQSTQRAAITVARGRAYVRLARAGLLPLSGGFDALAAHASRLERLRRALGRDLKQERHLAARRVELVRAIEDFEARPMSERRALERAREAIAAAAERDEAFRRAFQTDWDPGQRTAVYGARAASAPPAVARGGFASQRGRLPFPLAGRSEIEKLRSPSGSGKALVMRSSGGAKVRAVYPGRVAFADEYPNLGSTVIIDHGGHYYTVSAHLQRITVEVGDELSSGQQIGIVGNYAQKPGLFFEVRSGGDTLDTPEWFGI